jgi:hypothetical protein
VRDAGSVAFGAAGAIVLRGRAGVVETSSKVLKITMIEKTNFNIPPTSVETNDGALNNRVLEPRSKR